jgi:hypothetical protein
MRLIEEKDCGDSRTLPITLHEITANPYILDSIMSPSFQSNYKTANHAQLVGVNATACNARSYRTNFRRLVDVTDVLYHVENSYLQTFHM